MEIRRAVPEDTARLLEHMKSLKDENLDVINPISHLPSLEEEREYINRFGRGGGILLVCDSEGVIFGALSCARMKKRARPTGNIGMSVAVSHRRKGIGEALLIRLIDEARRRNLFECLWLEVDSRNLPARKLYEKIGFEYVNPDSNRLKMEYMMRPCGERSRG
jgi:ribosomal protein S18 acetylase RimI-like enzyme